MSKTPYDIRTELLHLAERILSKQHEARASAQTKEHGENLHLVTTSPTTEEIIAEAKKLNEFVSSSR